MEEDGNKRKTREKGEKIIKKKQKKI